MKSTTAILAILLMAATAYAQVPQPKSDADAQRERMDAKTILQLKSLIAKGDYQAAGRFLGRVNGRPMNIEINLLACEVREKSLGYCHYLLASTYFNCTTDEERKTCLAEAKKRSPTLAKLMEQDMIILRNLKDFPDEMRNNSSQALFIKSTLGPIGMALDSNARMELYRKSHGAPPATP